MESMSNANKTLCPVILAGGGGTRLWPLSREQYPKQFLSFGQDQSMLQQALSRISAMNGGYQLESPVLICNEDHRFLVSENADEIHVTPKEIILEPVGRNTAPALTIAAIRTAQSDPVLLIMPADHLISDTAAFHEAVGRGYEQSRGGKLVTFGIRPDYAETGYGYLKTGGVLADNVYAIDRFVEKPDLETAEGYVKAGNYYWNSGIFMMRATVWLEAIRKYRPDIYEACVRVNDHGSMDGIFFRMDKGFADCPADSIDYAVMEKVCTDNDGKFSIAMVKLDAGWSDLGSWAAIYDASRKDKDNNFIKGDVITDDTHDSIIESHHRLVAAVGCDNILVVETADAVLVGNRSRTQEVKNIVTKLKNKKREEALNHRRVYRPWGSYESLDAGEHFQVKRLVVNPGKKLSLQLHHRRAEHWVVVTGIATVTRGDEIFDLEKNQSTFIPLGEKHRLENKQDTVLEVIEVQSGDYLGEDDIVRFDDDFGRHK